MQDANALEKQAEVIHRQRLFSGLRGLSLTIQIEKTVE